MPGFATLKRGPRSTPARRRAVDPVLALEPRTLLAGAIGSIAPLSNPVNPVGDWTVMVYMTATDLAAFAPGNIREMERAAARLPDSVRIVLLYDQWSNVDDRGRSLNAEEYGPPYSQLSSTHSGRQEPWSTAGIGLIQPADPNAPDQIATEFAISDVEVDTGSPETLANFVSYAAMLAPAHRYALVMWDHGGGVESLNNDTFDILPNSNLTTRTLVDALGAARSEGVRLDLLAFDECLMSTVEVAHALRDVAPIVVASEELVSGTGQDYEAFLRVLETNPGRVAPVELARSMVSAFQARYGGRSQIVDTLAALDVSRIDDLTEALRGFVTTTQSATPRDWRGLVTAWTGATTFNDAESTVYRDLGQFMAGTVESRLVGSAVREAADGVLEALGSVVFARTEDTRRTMGLSIFFPPSADRWTSSYTAEAAAVGFLDATGWTSFLSRFYDVAAKLPQDWRDGPDWAHNDHGPLSALDLGLQTGARQRAPDLTIDAGETAWFQFSTQQAGRRGDAVRVIRRAGAANVLLRVYSADTAAEQSAPIAQGFGAATLRGLPAGEYLLSATAPRASAARFGLAVAAPRLPGRSPDLPGRNDSMKTAEDLGVVLGSRFVPGLSRSSDWQDAWYKFSTPRSTTPVDGLVTLMTDGQPMELSLYDDQGRLLSRARGNNLVQLPYAAPGGADSFFLKIGGRRGAYSLFFTDEA